jgi:uncharacterized protein with HEPN domain
MVAAGVEQKQWISTLDNRVRDSHALMYGEVARVDMPFSNGLQHPGGEGPAGEVINCRCTVAPYYGEEAKPEKKPAIETPENWNVESMASEEQSLMDALDVGNDRERSGETKRRISEQIAARLEGNQDWQHYVAKKRVEAEVKWAKMAEEPDPLDFLTPPGAAPYKPPPVKLPESADVVSDVIAEWATTSGDTRPIAIAMQVSAKEEFGLAEASLSHFDQAALNQALEIVGEDGKALRAFLRAQYDETQAWLGAQGIEEVTLYRGAGVSADVVSSVASEGGKAITEATLQPISSFSCQAETARDFAATSRVVDRAVVMAERVPASRIVGTCQTGYGCKAEGEFIVLGSVDEVRMTTAFKTNDLDLMQMIATAGGL